MADAVSTKNPTRDIGIFFLFVLLLGVFWFVRGGTEKAAQNPPPGPFLSSGRLSSSGSPGVSSGSSVSSGGAGSGGNVYYPPPISIQSLYDELGIDENFISGDKESDKSEYQGRVTLGVAGARYFDPGKEYIEITASFGDGQAIDITGWTIEGKSGLDLKIPQAVRLYLSNQINKKENIVLGSGEKIILSTGHSPIGDNFLLNKCSGYFSQHQIFTPSLILQCPRPADEEWSLSLSDACLDYIKNLPACRANFSHPLYLENSCIEAVNKTLNYNSCVNLHKGGGDFYKKEWRVYLGREEELWDNTTEKIILYDNKGLRVDTLVY